MITQNPKISIWKFQLIILIIVFSIIILYIALGGVWKKRTLKNEGVETKALISGYNTSIFGDMFYHYEYEWNGKNYYERSSHIKTASIGDSIDIVILPDNPSKSDFSIYVYQ